jgi:hypothetical protein
LSQPARAAAALLLPLLLLPAPAALGGEEPPEEEAGKLHWTVPERVAAVSGDSRSYGGLAARFADVRVLGDRLLVSAIGPSRGVLIYERLPGGGWVEHAGPGQVQQVSRWVLLGEQAVLLTGGNGGVQAVVVSPGAAGEDRVKTCDVNVPQAPAGAMAGMFRQHVQVWGVDAAAHRGKLFALSLLSESGRNLRVVVQSSADRGGTWSEPEELCRTGQRLSSTGSILALWDGGEKLHAVVLQALAEEGGEAGPRHWTSADGGDTWEGAAELPAPEEGAKILGLRAVADGREAALLVAGGAKLGAWLYRSSDGGEGWAAPRRLDDLPATKGRGDPLMHCHLALGARLSAFGRGSVNIKQHHDRKTGRVTMSVTGRCRLTVSRDGGVTWREEPVAEGMAGAPFGPACAPREDGSLDAILGWASKGVARMVLLHRRGLPQAPPPRDQRTTALVAALITDLAHEDYRVRERAAAGLRELGVGVLPDLRRAASEKDPERSLAAEHLIRVITPPWWKE